MPIADTARGAVTRVRAGRPCEMSADARHVVVVAPGRSGSTLLQTIFLTACDSLTFFEPCRHIPSGDVRKQQCADQVLRFLKCDLPSRNGKWNPPNLRGWLLHPYKEANTSCPTPPFRSLNKLAPICKAAKLVLVKEIRLVGQLSLLASTLRQGGVGSLTVIHLVRDPRPMLASQIKLRWWNLLKGGRRELERVARRTCTGMESDAAAGAALHSRDGLRYVPVRFEDLVANTSQVTQQLYSALEMPVPPSTRAWLHKTLRGECVAANSSEQLEYATCRNTSVRRHAKRHSWKHSLSRRQKRIITQQCSGAMRRFGYEFPAHMAEE